MSVWQHCKKFGTN